MRMDLCAKGFFLCFFLILFFSQANAIDVSENISADTTWGTVDSPYTVTTDVIVNSGITLTIDPGVVVNFLDNTALTVNGTLIARGAPSVPPGTPRNPIIFTSSVVGERWKHISFHVGSDAVYDMGGAYQSGSIIEIAIVENAGNQTDTGIYGAIQLNNAHPFLNDITVQNNTVSGIYGNNLSSEIKILASTISNNSSTSGFGGGGIYLGGVTGSQANIGFNTIQNNNADSHGGGVYIQQFDSLILENNPSISGNQAVGIDFSGGGIYVNQLGGTTTSNRIVGNTIVSNTADGDGGGIWVDNANMTIENNKIKNNDAFGGEGGGLFIGADAAAVISITKNMLVGNNAVSNGGSSHINDGAHTVSGNVIYKNTTGSAGHGAGIDVHDGTSTITGNVIAENSSGKQVLNMLGVTAATGNAIVNNKVNFLSAFESSSLTNFSDNTVVGNSTPDNLFVIENTVVTPMVNNNNIFNNLANLTFITLNANLNADSNWWGTNVLEDIQNMVSNINNASTEITTATPHAAPLVTVPISPPDSVSVTVGAAGFTVTWNANPEADVAGYNVYSGTSQVPDIKTFDDAGNVLEYIIPLPPPPNKNVYYIAVTAYDSGAGQGGDDPATEYVNEDQTSGVESWFSLQQAVSLFEADLSVAIVSDVGASINAGDPVTYTVTVTNNGPDVANNIVVASVLPIGSIFVSAPSACTEKNGTVTCNIIELAGVNPDNSATFDIVTTAPVEGGLHTNSVSVSSIDIDTVATNDSAFAEINVVTISDLSVEISAPASVVIGGSLTYRVTVINNGPSIANNVQLVSTLPGLATFVSTFGAGVCEESSGIVTCTLSELKNRSFNNTAVFNIIVDAPAATQMLSSTMVASADEIDPDGSNNTAVINTSVILGADLSIVLNGPVSVTSGESMTYSAAITNIGPDTANNIVFTSTLPTGAQFVSASSGCAESGGVVTCDILSLNSGAPGNTASIDISINAPDAAGTITTTAAVAADEADPLVSNNSALVDTDVIRETDLSVAVSADSSVTVGGSINYSITVTNNGPKSANNIVVEITLPAGTTFVSASNGCTQNNTIVTCDISTLDSLSPNNVALLEYTVTASSIAGTSTSNVTVTADENDLDESNDTATVTTTVNAKSSGGGGAFGPLIFVFVCWVYLVMLRKRKVI